MSEVLNLIKENPDSHIYDEAARILSSKITSDYSFVIRAWDHQTPKTKYKKILISTSDETHQTPKEINDDSFAHIFKQYAPMADANNPQSVQSIPKVSPIPLCCLEGVENLNIPILEREYDWSWMGQYDPYRRADFRMKVNTLCEDPLLKKKVLWYDGWNNGVTTNEYSDIINNTKVMLVPQGSGSFESFRFFEAMMTGCIVVTRKQPLVDFYNVAPCVKVESWRDLSNVIKNIISKTEEIRFLSEQARAWHNHFCSPEGLAQYMCEVLKRRGLDV